MGALWTDLNCKRNQHPQLKSGMLQQYAGSMHRALAGRSPTLLCTCSLEAELILTLAGQYAMTLHLNGTQAAAWTLALLASSTGPVTANVTLPLSEVGAPCLHMRYLGSRDQGAACPTLRRHAALDNPAGS